MCNSRHKSRPSLRIHPGAHLASTVRRIDLRQKGYLAQRWRGLPLSPPCRLREKYGRTGVVATARFKFNAEIESFVR